MGKSAVKGLMSTLTVLLILFVALVTIVAAFAGEVSPARSKLMPLLGLSVPVLSGINLFLLIILLYKRRMLAWAPLAALLFQWNFLTAMIQFNPSAEKAEGKHYLKVATYNVHAFGSETTGYSCRKLANYLKEEGMEVLCFQEFAENPHFNYDSICQALAHWPYHILPTADSLKRQLPIAIFSRYPLKNARYITYPESANCSLIADVELEAWGTVRLINNHLQTTSVSQKRNEWQRGLMNASSRRAEVNVAKDAAETLHDNFQKRAAQAEAIGEEVVASPYPVILCGDLNSLPSSYTYHHLTSLLTDGFREAGFGYMHTVRMGKRLLRIDYLLHDKRMKAISYHSPDVDFNSDHNPVFMEVELP